MFEEGTTDHSTVLIRFAKFRSGNFRLGIEPRGRPQPKINNDKLKAIVESDTFQTTLALASKFGVSMPTILDHLRQINNVKQLNRWVPHELKAYQMKKRFDACVSLLSRNKGESSLLGGAATVQFIIAS